ncbi:MAG: aldehyde dehydrogenase [Promicromonosporaceae bacterium]|nr:aldehyde dehydrogenase [Promicromonosporaceae bacterium]
MATDVPVSPTPDSAAPESSPSVGLSGTTTTTPDPNGENCDLEPSISAWCGPEPEPSGAKPEAQPAAQPAEKVDYGPMLDRATEFFKSGATRPLAERIEVLRRLHHWILTNDAEICDALYADLHKAPFETWATEIGVVVDELKYNVRHLPEWIKPERVRTNIKVAPARGYKYPEPYGTALIMAPWNYPFMLTIDPLIAAIAAGNCAILKPSNYSPHTSDVISKMVSEVFEPGHVSTVLGGRVENAALLNQRFDIIFFTGSQTVGQVVLQAAAKFLTPVILELGGKSPCIVDNTADIRLAAKRIMWGKILNAGQTCVAPDYVMAHEDIADELVSHMVYWVKKFADDALNNPDYPHIINDANYNRIMGLIDDSKVVVGGKGDPATRAIEPTIMTGVTWNDAVMSMEIFGPVLPILTWSDPAEVIREVGEHPHPLSTYIFSRDPRAQRYFRTHIQFGGGCINDVVVQVGTELPFGGLGHSGMSSYHGKAGFDAFTHYKSVLHRSEVDIPLRYPPYDRFKLEVMRRL